MENKNNMEDDRVAILEAQLAQAKLIAEEADKKYEEVAPASSHQHCHISISFLLLVMVKMHFWGFIAFTPSVTSCHSRSCT